MTILKLKGFSMLYVKFLALFVAFIFMVCSSSLSYASDCKSTINYGEGTIVIPCLEIENKMYELDIKIKGGDPFMFELYRLTAKEMPLTLEDIMGKYDLIAFEVKYNNGITMNQNNVNSFSGIMEIHNGYMTQNMILEGHELPPVRQNINLLNDNTMRTSFQNCTYDINISFDGSIFTTFLPTGTCGINYSEQNTWKRVGQVNSKQRMIFSGSLEKNIGFMHGSFFGRMLDR